MFLISLSNKQVKPNQFCEWTHELNETRTYQVTVHSKQGEGQWQVLAAENSRRFLEGATEQRDRTYRVISESSGNQSVATDPESETM